MSKKLRAAHGDLLYNLHVLAPQDLCRSSHITRLYQRLEVANYIKSQYSCSIQLPQDRQPQQIYL